MSPPNVLITRHGEVKIVDFGLAKANSQLETKRAGHQSRASLAICRLRLRSVTRWTCGRTSSPSVLSFGKCWQVVDCFMGETDLETVRQVQAAKIPPITQFNPTSHLMWRRSSHTRWLATRRNATRRHVSWLRS